MNFSRSTLPYLRTGARRTIPPSDLVGAPIIAYGARAGILTNRPELLETLLSLAPVGSKLAARMPVDRIFTVAADIHGAGGRSPSVYRLLEDEIEVARSDDRDSILEIYGRQLKMFVAEHARNRIFIHAGAVGWKGQGIIIPGRTFTGKTTLVAELIRAGATYYSDEYAVIDLQGRLHPYPAPLGVRDPLTHRQEKVYPERIGTRPLQVSLVVFCKYRPRASWRPREISAGQATLQLLDNTIPARIRSAEVLPLLTRLASDATIFSGFRGEAAETAFAILSNPQIQGRVSNTLSFPRK